jgi:hypothetical protein
MPAAAPIPRGPSVTTLYSAADLLTGPGCPVCRYAGEASARYLAWFALEAHAQADTITRLCASLGMCPRHTRGLMSQPGAAARLTVVYRYVVEAARDRLTGRAARLAGCPACERDDGAAGRALDTVLEGLGDASVRELYRQLGGMCLPHLRLALGRRDRRAVGWLAQTLAATMDARPGMPGWLAGSDHDADVRAALRQVTTAVAHRDPGTCLACLAAGRSESGQLARILRVGLAGRPDRGLRLCAAHLGDLAVLAGPPGLLPLLAWQAGCLGLGRSAAGSPGGRRASPASRPWLFRRSADPGGCPVCAEQAAAARRAVDDVRALLRATQPASDHQVPLCVRHLLALRAADPRAGNLTAASAVDHADLLIAELNEAFRKNTWAHRRETQGPEATAWRRAAAFLDGGVFCGGPPRTA